MVTLGEADGVLLIDGSDLPKQGNHSAGVARQWCGAPTPAAGERSETVPCKRDNCQAGVYLGYASRQAYTLLDRRLYLPACWFTPEYQERWDACPGALWAPASTPFQTKPALAAGMVEQLQAERRVRARWLACDEGYGQDPVFLDRVDVAGLWYLAEVPRSTFVWPLVDPTDGTTPRARPTTGVPPATSGRGRPPSKVRLQPESPPPLPVEALATLPAAQWCRYRLLEGSKGPLVAEFAAVRAVAVRDGLPGPDVWVLLRRPLPTPGETPEVKYYLSQAPADTPLATLVRVSGMRWPIEACFEEGKEEVGLDHYELRFWRGWYHHMTLVILAPGTHEVGGPGPAATAPGPERGGTNSKRPIHPCHFHSRHPHSRHPRCRCSLRRWSAWTAWTPGSIRACSRRPPCGCLRCPRCANSCGRCYRCLASTSPPPWRSSLISSATTSPPTAPTANAPSSA